MPAIDWAGAEPFGIPDRFVTEVTGCLNTTTAGRYDFRLTSDDGARLILGGTQVIDHGGKHRTEPATSTV